MHHKSKKKDRSKEAVTKIAELGLCMFEVLYKH